MIVPFKYQILTEINKLGKFYRERLSSPRFKVKVSKHVSSRVQDSLVIDSYIFNWRGQLLKTREKEEQLRQFLDHVTVINSDEKNEYITWVNVGEEAYFSNQFRTALNHFEGDILFHIQGDASFANWEEIVNSAKFYLSKYNWGVYAPNVNYTYHVGERVNISSVSFEEDALSLVTIPDTTCWFIHKDVIEQFNKSGIDIEESNKFGWGIDWVMCALSFRLGRPVIRDYSFCVDHPTGTGYNAIEANAGFSNLISSLAPEIRKTFSEMYNNSDKLYKYFAKILARKYLL